MPGIIILLTIIIIENIFYLSSSIRIKFWIIITALFIMLIILFTCSNIRTDDYQVNDYIKVINNNTFQLLQALQNPLKIEGIKDNIIVCNLDIHIDDGTYNDIDMKIMNMSNQNIVYFN